MKDCRVRSSGRRWWIVVVSVATLAGTVTTTSRMLRINFTSSLPRGIYRIEKEPPSRGDMVLACLLPAVAQFARRRGYVWRGDCPGDAAPVGKIVAGIAGDSVVVTEEGLFVNGRPLPNTAALARDSRGRSMAGMPHATYVVPAGELWLISTYNRASFDSRYFGPVPVTSVLSRIEPLWTLRAGIPPAGRGSSKARSHARILSLPP